MEKEFFFVKLAYQNGHVVYYGKEGKDLPLGDACQSWYIKEYGYPSMQAARNGMRSLKAQDRRLGQNTAPGSYSIEKTKLTFSEEDARRFGYIA